MGTHSGLLLFNEIKAEDTLAKCYLALGSNMGNKVENLTRAVSLINAFIGVVVQESVIYHSEPWGKPDQADFVNQVVCVETSLTPFQVLDSIQNIESGFGRKRAIKWGKRIIDIDILFYDELIVDEPMLKIPHPYISSRNFVLKPLYEIAPYFVHPVFSKTIKELYLESKDQSLVTELESNN